jgi:hypothetical protein
MVHKSHVTGKMQARKAVPVAALQAQRPEAASPEERNQRIAVAAYLIAEQRGFQGDCALDDWLQAEAEVDGELTARH